MGIDLEKQGVFFQKVSNSEEVSITNGKIGAVLKKIKRR